MIITTLANKPRARRKVLCETHTDGKRPDMTVEHVFALPKYDHIDIDVTDTDGTLVTVRLSRAEAERIERDIRLLLRIPV